MAFLSVFVWIAFIIGLILYEIHRVVKPTIPVKGTTNLPGPTSFRLPFTGDALYFLGLRGMKGLLSRIKMICQSRPKMVSFYLFSKLIIWIYDAEILEKISKSCPDKDFDMYGQLSEFTNGLVVTVDEKRWEVLRKAFNNILRKTSMDDFIKMFAKKAKITCEKIKGKCGQGTFDVRDVVKYFTFDITLEVFLDVPGNQQEDRTLDILPSIEKFVARAMLKLVNPLLKNKWVYRFSTVGRDIEKSLSLLKPNLQKLVDDSMEKIAARKANPNDPNFEPENYLEALIHIGLIQKQDQDNIVFSLIDIITAGFDTTGTSIASLLLFLAMHPEYQEKAYEEQMRVMGDSLRAPNRNELTNMKYLDMVFNETLRVTGVPMIFRILQTETKIDDYVLPQGATIGIFFNAMLHDTRYWEKPDSFYPDHFTPENIAKRPKFATMPFSFGKRACPGKTFGLYYSKLVTSMLLRQFRFTTPVKFENLTFTFTALLEIEGGYPIEATQRTITTSS